MHDVSTKENHTSVDLYAIMSSIAAGVISIDQRGRIVFINRAAQGFTGWREREALGLPLETVFKLIKPKTREQVSVGASTDFGDYLILISKTGKERYIAISLSPIKGEQGQALGVAITFQDAACHRQIEEELKLERHNLRIQFQYAPVAMAIVDANLVVQDVNDHYIDMFKNLEDGALGKRIGESLGCIGTIANICGAGEECDRCLVRACILQVTESRIPYRDAEKRYQLMQKGRMVIRILRFNFAPLNIKGKTNVLITIDDMTEYRLMADKLKKSRDFYSTLFDEQKLAADSLKRYELLSEQTRDIILVIDRLGCIIEANKAALKAYGYTRKELLTKTIYDLRRDQNIAHQQLDGAFEDDIFFETIHYRKDGSALPVEVSSQSAILAEGKVVTSIIRDITERKQAEEAAQAAYKAKSEFLANMSHEIRTPLNGIIGMLDLTMLTELSHDQMDNLSTAKTCANSLLKIINDVLDFSKIEAGKLAIEQLKFNFKELMEKIAKVHNYQAREKGIELTYQLPIDLPPFLVGDPDRLQQVLNNLLGNAVKFTDQGHVGLIVKPIRDLDDDLKLEFSVVDTGIGISDDEMDKLFKSFSQIDGSKTRRFGGTGLGLVISKRLIEMMGGVLKVESEKEKGSVFSFVLSFGIGNTGGLLASKTGQEVRERTKTDARILLVEDDEVNQTVIELMLKEMGYRVDVANCGNEALELLKHKSYDLCLMDIQMPGLDGIQTLGIIRHNEQKKGKHMPIVAITAHALQGDRERLLAMGMDEYIAKPVQMSGLFILIERLLAKNTNGVGVAGDQELAHFLAVYADEIKPIVKEIDEKISKLMLVIKMGNMTEIEEMAHNIKTIASLISADKVKILAFRVELAARRGDRSEADVLAGELVQVFKEYLASIRGKGGLRCGY